MVKRSKQRDALKEKLQGRKDHPTAEILYSELKKEIPNISLATVYRNLRQLEEWGEISSISSSGATRFDPTVTPHSHFFCTECGEVIDVDDDNKKVVQIGQEGFDGIIKGCVSNYYGLCPKCAKEKSN